MDLRCYENLDDFVSNQVPNPQVLERLLLVEPFYTIDEDYFRTMQTEITKEERRTAIEWLLEVRKAERSDRAMVAMAANFMDRAMLVIKIDKPRLQLLAVTCFMLATKMRQPNPSDPRTLVDYTMHTYTVDEVSRMECLVLNALTWNVNAVVANDFLEPLLLKLPENRNIYAVTMNAALKVIDHVVCEFDFAFWQASHIAMGVIATVVKTIRDVENVWPHVEDLPRIFNELTNIDIETIKSRIAAMEVFVSTIIQDAQRREEQDPFARKVNDPFPYNPPSPGSASDLYDIAYGL